MAPKFNLIVDSCSELGQDFCQANGVRVLNFSYTEPGKPDGLQGVDDMFHTHSCHEFYEAMRAGAEPQTSQPSQLDFEEAFTEAAKSGMPTVYLAFDSAISGCYEGALMALERVKDQFGQDVPVYVVDTLLPSTPQNMMCYEAVKKRDAGATAEELVEWAKNAIYYLHGLFMVEDLDALARGGRIPKGVAAVAGKLNIKPILGFSTTGVLTFVGLARGRKKGLKKLAEHWLKTPGLDPSLCGIGNADCPEDVAALQALISKEMDPAPEFLVSNIGPTIGAHVGPSMISCFAWGSYHKDA